MNVFAKIRAVKKLVNDVYPEMGMDEIKGIVSYLYHTWHGKRRKKGTKLTKKELLIYELMLKGGYSPATVYSWMLLLNAPSKTKEKLRNKDISIKDALTEKRKHRDFISKDEKQFIDAVIRCVENHVSEKAENYPGRAVQW